MSRKKTLGIVGACVITIIVIVAVIIAVPTTKLTLADAPQILDLSSELPPGFTSSYSAEPTELDPLGTGSGRQLHTRGYVLSPLNPWYQIELRLWLADRRVAQDTSVEDILAKLGVTGDRVDVGSGAEAIKHGEHGSGLEILVIKCQYAYVVMLFYYSHPQDEYVPMIPLARVVVERLIEHSR